MPMPPQVGVVLRHDDEVALAYFDEALASRAEVALACGVALHWHDDLVVEPAHPPVTAHATRTAATTSVVIMITTSRVDR